MIRIIVSCCFYMSVVGFSELFLLSVLFFFFSSRRRHTRSDRDWSSDVCSSDLSWRCIHGVSSWGRSRTRGLEQVPLLAARRARLHSGGRAAAGCGRGWLRPAEIGRASCRERV